MIIIGIDPGTAITGYSIIKKNSSKIQLLDYGCIRTEAKYDHGYRLNLIAEDIQTLLTKWSPDLASVEKLFFNKNVKTAMLVAQARGVILQKLEENKVKNVEFTPLEIKAQICGYGKADKKMMQKMVQYLLGLESPPQPDDAADAIAAGLCLAHKTY